MDETSGKQLSSEIQLRPTLLQEDYDKHKKNVVSDNLMTKKTKTINKWKNVKVQLAKKLQTNVIKNIVQSASSSSTFCEFLAGCIDWDLEEKEEDQDDHDDDYRDDKYVYYKTLVTEHPLIFITILMTYAIVVSFIAKFYLLEFYIKTKRYFVHFIGLSVYVFIASLISCECIVKFLPQIVLGNSNEKTDVESIQTVKFDEIYFNKSTISYILEFNRQNPPQDPPPSYNVATLIPSSASSYEEPPPAYDDLVKSSHIKSIKSPWSFYKLLLVESNHEIIAEINLYDTFVDIVIIVVFIISHDKKELQSTAGLILLLIIISIILIVNILLIISLLLCIKKNQNNPIATATQFSRQFPPKV